MQFRKFIIENYRAVEFAEVAVANNLIPLIGINESGKTSILQAILSFDKLSDGYAGGNHLDFKNKYILGEHDCTITAEVVIDREDDLDKLSHRLRLMRGNSLILALEDAYRTGTPFRIRRNLSTRAYSVEGLDVPAEKNEEVAEAIYRILPFLLYFDDFTDRVPDLVDYIRTSTGRGFRLRNPRLGEWNRILEEIFRRATNGEHSLNSFVTMSDEDDRRGLLSDINDVLNREIIDAWKELRQQSGRFADDTGDLSLELSFNNSEKGFQFRFKVEDRSTRRARWFDVVDRSKGFQWFFNFQMKLKFNPKYQEDTSGAIYLLDEPGSYLHASAQAELLSTLHSISETNTILYCTHSQHLLDPDKINIADTRIVHKHDGKVTVIPFGSAKTRNNQGALTPLLDALHIRTGVFNRTIRNAVITEGITDFYFFKMLSVHRAEWRELGIDIIPGSGASQLKDLISMSIAFSDRYCVLLDSDRPGRNALKRYIKFFGEHQRPNFFTYATPFIDENVQLEDFFSARDAERLLGITGAEDVKSAITKLYFHDRPESFWRKIDSDTEINLSVVLKYLRDFVSNRKPLT